MYCIGHYLVCVPRSPHPILALKISSASPKSIWVTKAGVALWPFFFYVASYVVPQICHDIYATGLLEVARVGHK